MEVWSKFFENAATLNQVKNGGKVNGLRVYRVPQVEGFEWPDSTIREKISKNCEDGCIAARVYDQGHQSGYIAFIRDYAW